MVLNSGSQSISGTLAGIPDTSINPLSTDDSSIHFDILGFITGWLSDINIQQSQDPQVRFLTWSCFQDPQPAGSCPRACPQIQIGVTLPLVWHAQGRDLTIQVLTWQTSSRGAFTVALVLKVAEKTASKEPPSFPGMSFQPP